jgi:hypothetical protein
VKNIFLIFLTSLSIVAYISCVSVKQSTPTRIYAVKIDAYVRSIDSNMYHLYDTLFVFYNANYPKIKVYKANMERYFSSNVTGHSLTKYLAYYIKHDSSNIGEYYFKYKKEYDYINIDSFFNKWGCKPLSLRLDLDFNVLEAERVKNDTLYVSYVQKIDSVPIKDWIYKIEYQMVNNKVKDDIKLNHVIDIEKKYRKRLVAFTYLFDKIDSKTSIIIRDSSYVSFKLLELPNYPVDPKIEKIFRTGKIDTTK